MTIMIYKDLGDQYRLNVSLYWCIANILICIAKCISVLHVFFPGHSATGFCHPMEASHLEQYFLTSQAKIAQCPDAAAYVTIFAEKGQHIEIKALNLMPNSSSQVISVVDQGLEHAIDYQRVSQRLEGTFMSTSHQVTLVLDHIKQNQIISFKGKVLSSKQ